MTHGALLCDIMPPMLREESMKHLRLPGLQFTLILAVVLPLLLVSGVAVYWGLGVIQSHDEERLQQDLALLAQATRYPLSRALQNGDYVQVNDIPASIFSVGRVYGASVYDQRGDRVSQVGIVDRDVSDSRSAADAVAQGDDLGTYREIEGEDVFSHFTPLFSEDGRIIGLLQITRQRSDFDQRLADLRNNAWWIWSLTAGAILLVAIGGHYGGVGRHVGRLSSVMARVQDGDRRIRAQLRGPRETRQLAAALNEMLDSIEAAEQEIIDQKARETRLNQRLQHQEKMAMIGRVAGGVAHELGAPLSVIDGRARMLERRTGDERGQRNLGDIRHQVQRMTRIVQQLLDCFRHSPSAAEERFTTAQLMTGVLDAHGDAPEGITLEIDNTAPEAVINGDRTRCELAVSNLLRNAFLAASSRVMLSVRKGPQAIAVTVEDDGPGIPPGDREAVLEPFHTTRASGEGTGLGLAVVRSVMQEHGGAIIIGSSRWGGCAMVLQWPRAGGSEGGESA